MTGCCTDKSCTSSTCMTLPAGKTCVDCRHFKRCFSFGFTRSMIETSCSFFPRKFQEHEQAPEVKPWVM